MKSVLSPVKIELVGSLKTLDHMMNDDGVDQNDRNDFWPQKCVNCIFQDSCTRIQFIAVNETFKFIW